MVAMLERKLAEVDVKLRTATGEVLYRTQGKAQQLEELLRDLTGAEQALERLEPSPDRMPRDWTRP